MITAVALVTACGNNSTLGASATKTLSGQKSFKEEANRGVSNIMVDHYIGTNALFTFVNTAIPILVSIVDLGTSQDFCIYIYQHFYLH